MKYLREFRDGDLAKFLADAIVEAALPQRHYRLMEFCGGHTHAIFRYGIQDLVPANIEFVHGPGCPVCVLPISRIDSAIELDNKHDVILCTYADLMRVPASKRNSLLKLKASGVDVRMIYSNQDALRIARENPEREVVFFAIGFETTTPPTAVALLQAEKEQLNNFSVYCNHVLTPAALRAILDADVDDKLTTQPIDGFFGPSHVSAIIGSRPYEYFTEAYQRPLVIAGFEPLDIMQSTLMLIRQLNDGRAEVENEYIRVVDRDGNRKAQALVAETMAPRPSFEWRGLGEVADSALQIRERFAAWDAERKFAMTTTPAKEIKSCECPAILRGQKKPVDCKLFGNVCTPENPMGSCMVSSEGACAAYYSYGRLRQSPSTIEAVEL